MTEEPPAANGSPSPSADASPQGQGGRLKFFKDGKFILELARAREGAAWVAVPRKPSSLSGRAARPHNAHPHPFGADSLSASDDNSSVQSSPWQRDHCWKQAAPRRGLSRELAGCYVRPKELPEALLLTREARRKRRRPFDPAPVDAPNGDSAAHRDLGKFKFFRRASETRARTTLRVYAKSGRSKTRRRLRSVVRTLAERPRPGPDPNADRPAASPRKRALREPERPAPPVDDDAKRTKPRSAPEPGPSRPEPAGVNGTPERPRRRDAPAPRPVSNYSINSLLSRPEDAPSRESPESRPGRGRARESAASGGDSPAGAGSPDPTVDGSDPRRRARRRSAYAPQAYASPGRSGASSASPRPPEKYYYPEPYANADDHPAYHPLHFQPTAYFPHAAYLGASYPHYAPRAPPPFWLPYPVVPPGPWAPLPSPLLTDRLPREDASSDLPLNLSKH